MASLSLAEAQTRSPATNQLKCLLSETIRVTISDGRFFIGDLAGTDKPLNIILLNVEEYRLPLQMPINEGGGRFVGQVMIPWKLVTKVEAQKRRPSAGFRSNPNLFI